ncbi:hypothetical protein vBValSX1_26 [Vibrio phage vB_ValS_X1]|uniref:Uncharacterized protein n=1 Tax=Vibrio phage vB_ValS_X1 TaxID=2736341 RepID=A0A6M9Z7U8_9CAUD|nr:hypothetical protein vBValSX1_26 [Vibrio phage vB_ValS_X1]
MGKERPKKKKKYKRFQPQGCRVFPLSIALLGADIILQFPIIYRIQKNEDLSALLLKRKRLITELRKENLQLPK